MGVFDFVKDAGAKVGIGDSTEEKAASAAAVKAAATAASAEKAKAVGEAMKKRRDAAKAALAANQAVEEREQVKLDNEAKAVGMEMYLQNMGLDIKDLDIRVHNGRAQIRGEAADQETRERAILAVGNTTEIEQVHDLITVPAGSAAESDMHVVVKGDTLWAIAQEHYGDGNKYPTIFEANKPMLTDPDKIYVGQVLRIPAA